jgi:hypothetical protein
MAARSSITYSNPRVKNLLNASAAELLPSEADLLYAIERQKSRILQRTERGVDVEERPFAPYSTKGPYYYYPNGPVGKSRSSSELKRHRSAVKRTGGKGGHSSVTRSGLGLRFESYAAFKYDYLGRTNVDLTGPRAPHMLQAIVTEAESGLKGSMGIYGDPGKRAAGHNEGFGHLPQREFFAVSAKDKQALAEDLGTRIRDRLKREFGV